MSTLRAQPGEILPAVPLRQRGLLGRGWFAWTCAAVLLLTLVMNPDRPTGGVDLCPMKNLTGQPCPGCGVTRGMVHIGHGQFVESVRWHPLAPAAWLIAAVAASSLLWPERWRARARLALTRRGVWVRRLVLTLVVPLLLFGLVRLVLQLICAPHWWPFRPA